MRAMTVLIHRVAVLVDGAEAILVIKRTPPVEDEMSGQMITSGWRIRLKAGSKAYEYRANEDQVRLYNYRGSNYRR